MANEKKLEEEKALISSCIQGNKASWDKLVQQYHKLVYSAINDTMTSEGWTPERDSVAELHQEIFLALHRNNYKKLKQFGWKNKCSFATWLYTITKNFVIDFVGKESTRLKNLERLVQQDDCDEEDEENKLIENESKTIIKSKTPLDELSKKERKELVHKALKELPEDDRELLTMFFLSGESHEDAAEILGKSVAAIYMQKKRALERLKKILKKYVGNDGL